MNNSKIIWSAVIVIAIISVIGLFTPIKSVVREGAVALTSNTNFLGIVGITNTKTGTACGDSNSFQYCAGTVVNGGVLSTTTSVSLTLQPSDLNFGVILMNPQVGSITVTLPATTTAGMSSFLPNIGDTTEIFLVNSTTTSSSNITVAGNTGMKLTNASTTAAITGGGSQGMAQLNFVRKANTDIGVQLIPSM